MDIHSEIEMLKGKHDSDSLVRLGTIYSNGPIEFRDYQQAIGYLEQAAQEGNSKALVNLAKIYLSKEGIATDISLGKKYLKQAMELNDGHAFVWYTVFSHDGSYDVTQEEKEQCLQKGQELIKAQNEHNAEDLYLLSFKFKRGNLIQDQNILKQAITLGFTPAMFDLAEIYMMQHTPNSINKGIKLLEKACAYDCAKACFALAIMYTNADEVKQDLNQAFNFFAKAVKLGYIDAMGPLGCFYSEGISTSQDISKAIRVWETGVHCNNVISIKRLALSYIRGQGVPQDISKGEHLLQKAIDLNDTEAMLILAGFFLQGTNGFPIDREKAKRILEKAVDLNDRTAMYMLANAYYGGLASENPEHQAIAEKLLLRSAELGDLWALSGIGFYYVSKKSDSPRLFKKGVSFLERGAKLGDNNCMHILGLLLCNDPRVLNKARGQKLLKQAPEWQETKEPLSLKDRLASVGR